MPVNKNQFRRLSAIVQVLNDSIGRERLSRQKLHFAINFRYDIECSKSTLEKDMATLRMDFDFPVKTDYKKGYYLEERFDFLEALKSYLNIFT